ncbi:AAA domain-containing protein, partial [Lactococcus garvieae]
MKNQYDEVPINYRKTLFIIKGEVKSDVEAMKKSGTLTSIKYANKEKTYNYSDKNVRIFKVLEKLSNETTKIWVDEREVDYQFAQVFLEHIRIVYRKGNFGVYEKGRVKIEKSALHNSSTKKNFDYLRELAELNPLEHNGTKLLSKNYGKCFVRKQSVLADYLKGNLLQNAEPIYEVPIFPFGFNISQKEAVEKAFQNKISIIEGPPGTGKTQTILNIIANAVMHNRKIAIVSSNNSATSNVFEKLQKYGLSFFAAFLGGTVEEGVGRKKYFLDHQAEIPDLADWNKNQQQKETLLTKIHELYADLQSKLSLRNQLARLEQRYEEIRLEYKYFKEDYGKQFDPDAQIILRKKLSSQSFMELWIRYENLLEQNKQFNFWRQLVNRFKLGIKNQDIY